MLVFFFFTHRLNYRKKGSERLLSTSEYWARPGGGEGGGQI